MTGAEGFSSWPTRLYCAVIGVIPGGVVGGMTAATLADSHGEIGAALFAACLVAGACLGLRVAVVSTTDQLVVRNLLRTHRIEWAEIAEIVDAGPFPYKLTSPAVVLRGRRRVIPIVAMLGWENGAGMHAASTIKRWGQSHRVATSALAGLRRESA